MPGRPARTSNPQVGDVGAGAPKPHLRPTLACGEPVRAELSGARLRFPARACERRARAASRASLLSGCHASRPTGRRLQGLFARTRSAVGIAGVGDTGDARRLLGGAHARTRAQVARAAFRPAAREPVGHRRFFVPRGLIDSIARFGKQYAPRLTALEGWRQEAARFHPQPLSKESGKRGRRRAAG